MKKVMVSMALVVLALGSQAQVLKNDLLKGYKEGDRLEKAVYDDKRAPINVDTWCGAFTATSVEGVVSPTVGKALTYAGYNETGPSINFGFPQGVKGSRVSVYSLVESGKVYSKGTYYLACLVNFAQVIWQIFWLRVPVMLAEEIVVKYMSDVKEMIKSNLLLV